MDESRANESNRNRPHHAAQRTVPRVLVDADSCPVRVRALIARSADRGRIDATFLANNNLTLPVPHRPVIVSGQSVDERIIREIEVADGVTPTLVVTRDIPLAEAVILRGGIALNDRGTVYDADSARVRRSERDAAQAIRDAGLESMNRARTYGERELRAFANALDRILSTLENRASQTLARESVRGYSNTKQIDKE